MFSIKAAYCIMNIASHGAEYLDKLNHKELLPCKQWSILQLFPYLTRFYSLLVSAQVTGR